MFIAINHNGTAISKFGSYLMCQAELTDYTYYTGNCGQVIKVNEMELWMTEFQIRRAKLNVSSMR